MEIMSNQLGISCTLAFTISLLLLVILPGVARRVGLVDHPGIRKQHKFSIPLIGGVAMFCGFFFAVLTLDVPIAGSRALFAGCGLMFIVGLLDDLRELSARIRFMAQLSAGCIMIVWGQVYLSDLGLLMGGSSLVLLGILAWPLTLFSTIGIINALNMADGVDGLSGSIVLTALISLAILALTQNNGVIFSIVLIAGSVVIAFLLFNWRFPWRRSARVFMGDAGSMFLGFLMGWLLISCSQGEQRIMEPVTALWIFALPIWDTVCVMFRRILNGRSPFQSDREHLHHMFIRTGFSVVQTVAILVSISALAATIGLLGHYNDLPEVYLFFGFLVASLTYFGFQRRVWRRRIWLGRMISET